LEINNKHCVCPNADRFFNKEEKCLVAVDLEMKSDCIVISSSSNDEIEIFEDDEVTAEEKNKATCDLHDLGVLEVTFDTIPFSNSIIR
jgi:hypothetical protein